MKPPPPAVLHALGPSDLRLLKRLLSDTAEYVPHDWFERSDAGRLLERSVYAWADAKLANDDSGVYQLKESREEVEQLERETFVFLRLNYCRQRVFLLLEQLAARRLNAEHVAELLRWERAVVETRGEIVRENVPLVLAMAKRTRITGVDLTDLISEGNLALLRAVNKFDCARGFRFSTYACRAILKSFSRVATRSARHRGHFPTEFDPMLERSNFVDQLRVAAEGDFVYELKSILGQNAAGLSDVEQQVVVARFGLDADRDAEAAQRVQTLEQVGELIGVTKERVRQIQMKALGKLRVALEQAVSTR